MNNTLFESLENQTAPESTRGLFDSPPVEKKVKKKKARLICSAWAVDPKLV